MRVSIWSVLTFCVSSGVSSINDNYAGLRDQIMPPEWSLRKAYVSSLRTQKWREIRTVIPVMANLFILDEWSGWGKTVLQINLWIITFKVLTLVILLNLWENRMVYTTLIACLVHDLARLPAQQSWWPGTRNDPFSNKYKRKHSRHVFVSPASKIERQFCGVRIPLLLY